MKAIIQKGPWQGKVADILAEQKTSSGVQVYWLSFEIEGQKYKYNHKQWVAEQNLEFMDDGP